TESISKNHGQIAIACTKSICLAVKSNVVIQHNQSENRDMKSAVNLARIVSSPQAFRLHDAEQSVALSFLLSMMLHSSSKLLGFELGFKIFNPNWNQLLEKGDSDRVTFRNCFLANSFSWGTVVNTFARIEQLYLDHLKRESPHSRVRGVGPLLLSFGDRGDDRGRASSIPSDQLVTVGSKVTGMAVMLMLALVVAVLVSTEENLVAVEELEVS
ncbi:UDP-glycosyltransferase 89B2, partial [Linum perenne]